MYSKHNKHLKRKKRLNRVLWTGAVIALLIYGYIFYNYVVSPYTLRWKALYGEIKVPSGYSIRGIDISHYQGTINWDKLSNSKIDGEPISFVFVKATEGCSLLDENFNDNFYQAREYGLTRGAYHYFRPNVSAEKQAAYYLKQVHLEDGDLPPVLDLEEIGNLSPKALRLAALKWLQIVEKAYKVKPILYTGFKFKTTYLSTPDFEKYPYWIAHYYVDSLSYKGEWKFWQHSDVGKLPGIKGKVDLNVYNGSMYDLRKLTIRKN